ncbi:hypothetical protein BJX63DRAFT_426654 [Aspergillus granulosus]|uniref:DNA 3'-5' helicase n=1 Tax=Aspergillus granulosus TaxID=176169 RepID=A0ABR4GR89_9EURO
MVYYIFRLVLPRGVPCKPHQWLIQTRYRQVIVYINTKSQVEAISWELEYKKEQTWVIAVTSILGMGINISNIWCVIYIGQPRMLLDYRQESGWAGRDKLASKAIIIHPDSMSELDFKRVQLYIEVVGGTGYRQYILDQYLNGININIEELLYNRYNPN